MNRCIIVVGKIVMKRINVIKFHDEHGEETGEQKKYLAIKMLISDESPPWLLTLFEDHDQYYYALTDLQPGMLIEVTSEDFRVVPRVEIGITPDTTEEMARPSYFMSFVKPIITSCSEIIEEGGDPK